MRTRKTIFSLVCSLYLLLHLARSEEDALVYQNEIRGDLDVQCPKGYGMNAVYGRAGFLTLAGSDPPVPNRFTHDHQWFWNCEKIGKWRVEEEYCYTYDIRGSFVLLAFRCPKDFYIAGLSRNPFINWSARCCRQPGLCISDCCLSEYINAFGGDIEHKTLNGNFFVGIFNHIVIPLTSVKRRWKVEVCRFQKCGLKHYLGEYYY